MTITIVIKSRLGVKRAELTATTGGRNGLLWLVYERQVNAPGLIRFALDADSPAVALLEQDGQVEVWREDRRLGIAKTREMTGLFRGTRYEPDTQDESVDDADSNELFIAACPGTLHLLSRRVNAYKTGTADRSSFTGVAVETIMRSLVIYNYTVAATELDGRIRTAAPMPISLEVDQQRGGTIDRGNSGVNVLTELQELARLGGLDFDLVSDGDGWLFRIYDLRGTDRSTGTPLSREAGTLNVLIYEADTTEQKTVAIVAGQGEGEHRATAVRTSSAYSTTQDIEAWVDARDISEGTSALETRGDEALRDTQKDVFDFQVQQTPGDAYGKHYAIGDLRRVVYRAVEAVLQVAGATVRLEDGPETIDITLAAR